MAQLFAVLRSRGPKWEEGKPLEQQADWPAHAAFMEALHDEGVVLLVGPLQGTSDALVIMRAGSDDEVAARLAPDPWTNSLLTTKQISRWHLRLGSLDRAEVDGVSAATRPLPSARST
jgi:uncharacterized protein YciI